MILENVIQPIKKIEGVEEKITIEQERYSAEEVFSKLKTVISSPGVVSDKVYGDFYALRERYPSTVMPNNEDLFLQARISALPEDKRKEIASSVGTFKFEVGVIGDPVKRGEIARQIAEEISKVIFPELYTQ